MKKMLKNVVLILAMALLFGVTTQAAVKKVQITVPTKKAAYTIQRAKENVRVPVKANVRVTKKSSKALTYKSSNPSVASITKKGVVVAKAPGKTTITVSSKENSKIKDTLKITVKQNITSIKASDMQLIAGGSMPVDATVRPAKTTTKKLTYKSSNTKVATVSANGTVKAVKVGTAHITITAKDNTKKSKTITVEVIKKANATKSVKMPADFTMDVLSTRSAKATVNPGGNKVEYHSSDQSIASVDSDGMVTGKRGGVAVITAIATDGSGKKDSTKVTVIGEQSIKFNMAKASPLSFFINGSIKYADPVKASAAFDRIIADAYKKYDFSFMGYDAVIKIDDISYYMQVTASGLKTTVNGRAVNLFEELNKKPDQAKVVVSGLLTQSKAEKLYLGFKLVQDTMAAPVSFGDMIISYKGSQMKFSNVTYTKKGLVFTCDGDEYYVKLESGYNVTFKGVFHVRLSNVYKYVKDVCSGLI